mgnify:CR=1 FL=1
MTAVGNSTLVLYRLLRLLPRAYWSSLARTNRPLRARASSEQCLDERIEMTAESNSTKVFHCLPRLQPSAHLALGMTVLVVLGQIGPSFEGPSIE